MAQDCSGGRFLKWADSPKCQCSDSEFTEGRIGENSNSFPCFSFITIKINRGGREAWHAAIRGGQSQTQIATEKTKIS